MNQRNEPMARFFWSVPFKYLYFLNACTFQTLLRCRF